MKRVIQGIIVGLVLLLGPVGQAGAGPAFNCPGNWVDTIGRSYSEPTIASVGVGRGYDNIAVIAARGTDNVIYVNGGVSTGSNSGVWLGWTSLGGLTYETPKIQVPNFETQLIVSVVGTDGNSWVIINDCVTFPDDCWGPWELLSHGRSGHDARPFNQFTLLPGNGRPLQVDLYGNVIIARCH